MIYDEIAMNNGVIFLHTFKILDEKMKQAIANLQKGSTGVDGKATLDAALFVSVIVNGTFACELFMKSMIPPNTRGHRLDKLFSLLDVDVQAKIKNKTVENIKKSEASYSDSNFQTDLTENTNLFAEWRYFHEHSNCSLSGNCQFISCFLQSIFDTVNEERLK